MNYAIKRTNKINISFELIGLGREINNLTSARILKIIKRGKGFIIRVLSFNGCHSLSVLQKNICNINSVILKSGG